MKFNFKAKKREKTNLHHKVNVYHVLNAVMKQSPLVPSALGVEVQSLACSQQAPLDFWSHLILFEAFQVAHSIFYIRLNIKTMHITRNC